MKKLYCFDFDGTLTKKDTMFAFLKYYNTPKYYLNFAIHLPLFVMLKLGFAKAEEVKKSFISSILKGESKEKIEQKALFFFEENYPKILRKPALNFIQAINKKEYECYLVTASLDIWTKNFAEKLGLKLLATQAHFENGKYSGKFASKNCNGAEKVRRIQKATEGQKFDKVIAFGDTSGDKEMLDWANEGHFRFFH